ASAPGVGGPFPSTGRSFLPRSNMALGRLAQRVRPEWLGRAGNRHAVFRAPFGEPRGTRARDPRPDRAKGHTRPATHRCFEEMKPDMSSTVPIVCVVDDD